MIVLQASHLSLSFLGREVLDDITFSVGEGDRLGIVGVNGVGKTTLLRLLAGELSPEKGEVTVAKGKTVGYLAQNTAEAGLRGTDTLREHMEAAFPELAALEEKIAALEKEIGALPQSDASSLSRLGKELEEAHRAYATGGGLEYRARCTSTLLRMGFCEGELDLPVSSLSGGQNTRLALARLLCRAPDILLLDEPTNHLDLAALAWLEDFLASYPKTVIAVSHDRYFLDRVTKKTLHLSRKKATLYPGNYSRAREMEEENRLLNEKHYKEQQKVLKRIRDNIEFQRRCGQEHNFVTIRSKEKQIERMEKVELQAPREKDISLRFSSADAISHEVVTAKDLTFSFGEKPLLSHLSFLIRRGDRVCLLGQNGCGKSTLMKLLTGELSPRAGHLRVADAVKVGYYDQENSTLNEENTVFGELRAAYPKKTDKELRSALALFLFGAPDMEKSVGVLSGGERARLTLSKLVLTDIDLLLLDEPTNHLDIGSREALEDALTAFPGTVVAVSHDRYFINRIATRMIEIDANCDNGCREYTVGEGEDAYALYAAAKEEKKEEKAQSPQKSEEKLRYEEAKRQAAERRSAERKRKEAQEKIPQIEEEIGKIEEELFGDAASDYVRAAALEERRRCLENELLALYELTM